MHVCVAGTMNVDFWWESNFITCDSGHGPLSRHVKLWVAHMPGMLGMFSPPPRVRDSDMHHVTCVTHVSWSMPGSLTSGFLWSRGGENVPGIPGACTTCNFTYLVRGPWSKRPCSRHCQIVMRYITILISFVLLTVQFCLDLRSLQTILLIWG